VREGVHLSSLRTDTPRNRKIQQSETNREKRQTKRVHCEPKLKGGGGTKSCFFFGRRPLPFGRSPLEAYPWTSGESNHHRQSVRVAKNDALPTEPRGHLGEN